MKKKIQIIGMTDCILHFVSVGAFLITKAEIALTA